MVRTVPIHDYGIRKLNKVKKLHFNIRSRWTKWF